MVRFNLEHFLNINQFQRSLQSCVRILKFHHSLPLNSITNLGFNFNIDNRNREYITEISIDKKNQKKLKGIHNLFEIFTPKVLKYNVE